jgi:hypothetical protein
MIKFKLLLLSFLFLNVFAAFSAENKDNSIKDTLNIAPSDTISSLKDTISVVPAADTTLAESSEVSEASPESSERKGEIFLWIMIGLLIVLGAIGFKIKHKD